jgi:hypothetical protein
MIFDDEFFDFGRILTLLLYAQTKPMPVHSGLSTVCCSHEQTPRLCRDNDP